MSVFANLMSVKLLALACSGREGDIKKDGAKTEAKTRRDETRQRKKRIKRTHPPFPRSLERRRRCCTCGELRRPGRKEELAEDDEDNDDDDAPPPSVNPPPPPPPPPRLVPRPPPPPPRPYLSVRGAAEPPRLLGLKSWDPENCSGTRPRPLPPGGSLRGRARD